MTDAGVRTYLGLLQLSGIGEISDCAEVYVCLDEQPTGYVVNPYATRICLSLDARRDLPYDFRLVLGGFGVIPSACLHPKTSQHANLQFHTAGHTGFGRVPCALSGASSHSDGQLP